MTTPLFTKRLGVGSFFSLASMFMFLPIHLGAGLISQDIILIFILLCVLPYYWMHNNWQLFWPQGMLFLITAGISASYSYFSNSAPGSIYGLWSMFLMPPLLYFSVIQIGHADKIESMERMIKWWGPFISLQLMLSLLFFIMSNSTEQLHAHAKIYWTSPNYTAALLVMPIIYLYGTLVKSKYNNPRILFCLGFSVLGIVATLSRGGLIAMFFGLTLFHWLRKDLNLKSVLYAAPATIGIYLGAALFDNRFVNLIDLSNINRLYLWLQAIEQFLAKPLFGGGVSKVWLYASFISKDSFFSGPHNFLLKLLMDEGIVGTIPYLTMIGLTLMNAHKLYRIEKDPTLLTLFVAALFNGTFEPTLLGYHYSFIFWFFAALTSLKLQRAIAANTPSLTSTPAPQ